MLYCLYVPPDSYAIGAVDTKEMYRSPTRHLTMPSSERSMALPKRSLPPAELLARSSQAASLPFRHAYIRKAKHWRGVYLAGLRLWAGWSVLASGGKSWRVRIGRRAVVRRRMQRAVTAGRDQRYDEMYMHCGVWSYEYGKGTLVVDTVTCL